MAQKIDAELEIDNEGPPEYSYRDYVYVTLPRGYGEIVCFENRWMEGSNWGLAIGDYNRGEVNGERVTLEARTSETNDTEDLETNGERTIIAILKPGSSFDKNTRVKLIVKHTLQGSIKVQAMSNAEKNPPAVAATSNYSWKQFDETDLSIEAKIEGDKQTVIIERKIVGKWSASAKVRIKTDGSGIGDFSTDLSADREVNDTQTHRTQRTSVAGVSVHQIISQVETFDILTRDDPQSKAFQVFCPSVVAANIGETDGFADASLNMNHSWIFDYEILKEEEVEEPSATENGSAEKSKIPKKQNGKSEELKTSRLKKKMRESVGK